MSKHGGSSTDAAIGLMEGAYFTGRKELLDFFNSLLDMNLGKIEQTATGAVACQLTEYIFPGSIPMKRVNWGARAPYEYVENYKLLQAAFAKYHVQRYVDVEKLIRAKYQDNLEFCQWLKAFYDQAAPPYRNDYDPLSVRQKGKGGDRLDSIYLPGAGGGAGAGRAAGGSAARLPSRVTRPLPPKKMSPKTAGPGRVLTSGGGSHSSSSSRLTARRSNVTAGNAANGGNADAIVADANLMKKNAELEKRNGELELTMSGIERERDFYFEKLRGIEVMLQVHEERCDRGEPSDTDELIKKVFQVLYATSDDNVVVGDDGEIMGSVPPENDMLNEENLAAGVEVHVRTLNGDVGDEESLLDD